LASALIFGPLFFPTQGPAISLIASFSTYFLGFAVRPVGGIIFGIIGDRLGRKFVLLATITLMGAASTLIGVLPTYASVGYWAPVMLRLLLRCSSWFRKSAGKIEHKVILHTETVAVLTSGRVRNSPGRDRALGTRMPAA
jgi:MFS family permease